jgi:acetyl-CoA carboxylase biotin carboxyl carrier protein
MDLERIEALLKLLAQHDVSEFSFKDEGMQIRLRLGPEQATYAQPMMAPQLVNPTGPVAAPANEAPSAPAVAKGTVIESPMVGTFYGSPSPDAPQFVEVGTVVTKGQTLCIVEAMKLMNEIEAEVAGTITEIHVDNAQPVQFGQALFTIS